MDVETFDRIMDAVLAEINDHLVYGHLPERAEVRDAVIKRLALDAGFVECLHGL